MRQFKTIGILIGVLLVFTVSYFVVDHFTEKKEKQIAASSTPVTLLSFDSDTATKLVIDNDEGSYVFEYLNSTWKLTSEEQFSINTYAISTICGYASILTSEKTIEENVSNLAAYGFDNPVTLSCYTSDGAVYTILVGALTPTGDAFYAMKPDSNTVYTIDYNSGYIFCASKDTLKNLYLFEVASSEITAFMLERDGDLVYELAYDSTSGWQVKAPFESAAYTSVINNAMDTFIRINLNTFVEENASDLEKYGLDDPSYRITAATASASVEILFGNMVTETEDETEIYAMFADTKQVFTITKAAVTCLEDDLLDVIYPYIYSAETSDVESITVNYEDIQDVLYVDYDNSQYSLNDVDLTALSDEEAVALFQDYYHAIATLGPTAIDLDAEPSGDAVYSIDYLLRDGTHTLIEFIPETDTTFWIMINGEYTGLITRIRAFTITGSIVPAKEALELYLTENSLN